MRQQGRAPASPEQELWYKDAIIYAIDVERFQDSNGDGLGDLPGLISRLEYLADLGVTCLWVLPFYRTPDRDNGYDIADYYDVMPSRGSLKDFDELIHRAGEFGMRIMTDLVVNHTSDEHPWFEAARRDPHSRFRDYYIWTDSPPPIPPEAGTIFPGQEKSVWTWDDLAGAFYYHRFYDFEPELKIANPDVRDEIFRIMDFWLSFGVMGFRVDAASHMIEERGGLPSTKPDDPHGVLRDMRELMERRRPGSVLIGESDVQISEIADYFGEGDELNLLFNFLLDNYLFLALARQEAEPIVRVLHLLPSIPHAGQWANFLRNLDELDLERLTEEERHEVYAAFAPEPEMQIFGRGVRRRLAPMLGGDRLRIEMAYSLLFSMPGTPVIVYGDELAMGDDLSLEGRNAVRTPMQWSNEKNGGFSDADPEVLVEPVISEGPFSYERVNVADQLQDEGSLVHFFRKMIRTRRECPEIGWGPWRIIESKDPAVLAHEAEWRGGHLLFVHNLGEAEKEVELDISPVLHDGLKELIGNADWEVTEAGHFAVRLGPYGYRWIRVREPH